MRAEAVGCAILVPAAEVPGGLLQGLALLAGSAMNQDGRSSSLTAPHGPSQQVFIRQALQDGGVAGAEVAVVQMHGTGTPLGGKHPAFSPPPLPPLGPQSHCSPSVDVLYLTQLCPQFPLLPSTPVQSAFLYLTELWPLSCNHEVMCNSSAGYTEVTMFSSRQVG